MTSLPNDGGDVFEALATVAELGEGTVLARVKSTGEAICLIRHRGEVSAVSGICTHEHFSMAQSDLLPDGTLQCAWHGARFDRRTGEVKQVPAAAPLPIYQVRIEGDRIMVGARCPRTGARYEASTAKIEETA